MTETSLGSPRTIDAGRAWARSLLRSGRIGRRVVGLFVVSALVPLILCAAILFHEFSAEMAASERRSLDDLIRSFGMTVIGRLGSADDAMKVVVSDPGTDESAREKVEKFSWAHRAQVSGDPGEALPAPDESQRRALQLGNPVLLWSADGRGHGRVHLIRVLHDGAWLYAELDPGWLWEGAPEFAGTGALLVLDNQSRTLSYTGMVPSRRHGKGPAPFVTLPDMAALATVAKTDGWISRSWELFLASRFSSPSWHVQAVREHPSLLSKQSSYVYLCGIIVATILLITWLSLTSIRRQLHPLSLLRRATERVAHRDFEAFRGMSWNDEFGDLARSFNAMSEKLRTQFAALETLAEVDRLLLAAPQLELILDKLLPRIAGLLRCQSVSVLLFDTDSEELARAYDYYVSQAAHPPVRRIASEVRPLKIACADPSASLMDVADAGELACLPSASLAVTRTVRLLALKNDGHCIGALCLGYGKETLCLPDFGMEPADFADRLSLILANLGQSERLRRQANFDSLTGLQNRDLFSQSVALAVTAAAERAAMGAVLYVDLDHFKRVNDTAGHAAGDGLLRIVAERLIACIGENRGVARLGGDEFAVLLPSIAEPDFARHTAEQIISSLRAPIATDAREYHLSASIGMAIFPADGTTLEELLKAADISMYHAKDAGRGRAVFFQSEMQRRLQVRLELENAIRNAFLRREFELHFQPIVAGTGPRTLGVEALARWPRTDDAPWTGPAVFIPIAEENGLIVSLGEWILRRACAQFTDWRRAKAGVDYISVNVSVRQLREPDFVANLQRILQENAMHGGELLIELTESVLAEGEDLRDTLVKIAALGVRLALDDFGTGYSSLSYLREYPIDTVKIDRSFIVGLPNDGVACRLVESIVLMCAALGKAVVAEGVETLAQRVFLDEIGCTRLQGYLLGRPMEGADIPGFAKRLLTSTTESAVTAGADTDTTRHARSPF